MNDLLKNININFDEDLIYIEELGSFIPISVIKKHATTISINPVFSEDQVFTVCDHEVSSADSYVDQLCLAGLRNEFDKCSEFLFDIENSRALIKNFALDSNDDLTNLGHLIKRYILPLCINHSTKKLMIDPDYIFDIMLWRKFLKENTLSEDNYNELIFIIRIMYDSEYNELFKKVCTMDIPEPRDFTIFVNPKDIYDIENDLKNKVSNCKFYKHCIELLSY